MSLVLLESSNFFAVQRKIIAFHGFVMPSISPCDLAKSLIVSRLMMRRDAILKTQSMLKPLTMHVCNRLHWATVYQMSPALRCIPPAWRSDVTSQWNQYLWWSLRLCFVDSEPNLPTQLASIVLAKDQLGLLSL
jgi:hypothetical protein